MQQYYVYALVNPITDLPFYIGKGTKNRAWSHLKEPYNPSNKKSNVINIIRQLGHEPSVHIIYETFNEKEAYDTEYFGIKYYHSMGIYLTNRVGVDLRPPSRKGIKWTAEAIAKRSASIVRNGSRKGKPMDEKQKAKIKAALLGREPKHKIKIDPQIIHDLYLIQNLTKKEVCDKLNIGLGSLNRILGENKLLKLKNNK